jgi:hypothetical protein
MNEGGAQETMKDALIVQKKSGPLEGGKLFDLSCSFSFHVE